MTLDAGGLIALDRDDRHIVVLPARAAKVGARVTVPASALAQVIRNPAQQARLVRLLRRPATTATTDVVDAHVVACGARAGQAIVTSDPDDLRHLDAQVRLVTLDGQ